MFLATKKGPQGPFLGFFINLILLFQLVKFDFIAQARNRAYFAGTLHPDTMYARHTFDQVKISISGKIKTLL
jgi:hypothetical protein